MPRSYLEDLAPILGKQGVLDVFAQSQEDLSDLMSGLGRLLADGPIASSNAQLHAIKGIALNMGLTRTADFASARYTQAELAQPRFMACLDALVTEETAQVLAKLQATLDD